MKTPTAIVEHSRNVERDILTIYKTAIHAVRNERHGDA
jgi:hypothetical protein